MVIILKQLSLSVHSRCLLAFLVLVELQNQWYIFYEGDIVKVYTIMAFCNSVFYRNTICTHNRANHQRDILTNCFLIKK
jgi:hypothetical protein